MNAIEVIPSARRMIMSLRDMGYDISQAIADVVDNSIEARATRVNIDLEFDGDDSWVRITDNGLGMKPSELREAMRYGSEREYSEEDLGKFGLGLKTASMSQCQKLSVASRWNRKRADISAYSWDLDHIETTNRWEILPVSSDDLDIPIHKPLKKQPGTVVLWERLDRILGYKHPYGEMARKRMSHICRDVEQHLAMVFHRQMSRKGSRRLKIFINKNLIHPWDPFCLNEPKTKLLEPVTFEGKNGEVVLEPYILPPKDDFSSPEAFRKASGPANWNAQQGFYFYRSGRLIQSGGWSRLRAIDEHTKLARVAVRFPPKLDDAFKINVPKMRVQMPASIREEVRALIAQISKEARAVYSKNPPKTTKTGSGGNSSGSSGTGGSGAGSNNGETRLHTFKEWSEIVLESAKSGEKKIIRDVIERIESRNS